MKLTIDPKLLADTVTAAARSLPQRPLIPVLSGLLLEATDDQLTVSAFDYDITHRGRAAADIAEPGRILLPGRVLAEVAKSLPTGVFVEVTATGTEATLTCGRAEFELPTLPVDDFPTLPEPPDPAGTVDGDVFVTAVHQVATACSADDTLPMLTGIRIDADGDTLTLAATDKYRIAVRDLSWQPATAGALGKLLPGRMLHDITRDLGRGPVTLAFDDQLAAFITDIRRTTIRLIDEQYIDYRARVSLDTPIIARVDAPALADAVKRVALIAERNTTIRLSFTAGEVLLQAGGADIGRGSDVAACELNGGDIEIAFQSKYLLDALNAIDGQAHIGMTEPHQPALITSEDGAYRNLTMSVRVA
ncbi:DNA polymerase III subunit beta [Nonomuraea rubra]|uniref:DNA polymerase III subunit beta n=1 Tax=Nonomuraea rubra TaxID=46180 RepID=UPI0033DEC379